MGFFVGYFHVFLLSVGANIIGGLIQMLRVKSEFFAWIKLLPFSFPLCEIILLSVLYFFFKGVHGVFARKNVVQYDVLRVVPKLRNMHIGSACTLACPGLWCMRAAMRVRIQNLTCSLPHSCVVHACALTCVLFEE